MFTLLRIRPVHSARRSAARYVPAMIVVRIIGFARNFIISYLLGKSNTADFGRYTLSLSLINWLVPVLMLGLGDVAERYASTLATQGRLEGMIRLHSRRLWFIGLSILAAIILVAPWTGTSLLRDPTLPRWNATTVLTLIAINALGLAFYQHTAALVRGVRAYTAAATMETIAGLLLLLLSAVAAAMPAFNAQFLLTAYALSNAIPACIYGILIRQYAGDQGHSQIDPNDIPHAQPGFAQFALLRLLFTMTFGLLAVWSVQYLSPPATATLATSLFSMPYLVGLFLASTGITLWSSAYAIAAAAWGTGDRTRARTILLKIGGIGGTALVACGLLILLSKPLILHMLRDAYHPDMDQLLSPALAMFILYAMLAWASVFGDLHERSWLGALIWGIAVAVQLAILVCVHAGLLIMSPERASLTAGSLGLAAGLVSAAILIPLVLRRTHAD